MNFTLRTLLCLFLAGGHGPVADGSSATGQEGDRRLPKAANDSRAAEQLFAAQVSDVRLRKTVRDLVALGPRMGGTPSGDASARHVAEQLQALGLDPVVVEDPPVQGYWADTWDVRLGPDGTRLESAWPYVGSPQVSSRSAPLLLVTTLSPPPGGWRGRIVYVPAFSTSDYAALLASADQPLAVLTSAPHQPDKYRSWSAISELPRLPAPTVPVFGVSFSDGSRVEAAARAGSTATVALSSHTRQASPRTVIATIPGRVTDKYYLVSAHGDSDSGGPGADDNASGVAVVLELARLLREAGKDGATSFPFSVRFVIWGQEYHSAHAYIAREGERLAGCLGVINIDEAGTGAEREAIYVEGNDVPWNRDLLRVFEGTGRDYRQARGFWPEFATNPTRGGTDSYAFLPQAYKGTGGISREIPSTTIYTVAWEHPERLAQTPGWMTNTNSPDIVITDYSRYYHSSGDTPDNTTEREPQNMVRAVKLIGIALLRLASRYAPG